MAQGKKSKKDKQMAAYLKKHKIERHGGRCAVCYKLVSNMNQHKCWMAS